MINYSVCRRLIEEIVPRLPRETLDRLSFHLTQQDFFDPSEIEDFEYYYDRIEKALPDRSLRFKTDLAWFVFSGNIPSGEEGAFQRMLEQDSEAEAVVHKALEACMKSLHQMGEVLKEKEIKLPNLGIENLDHCLKTLKARVPELDTKARVKLVQFLCCGLPVDHHQAADVIEALRVNEVREKILTVLAEEFDLIPANSKITVKV